MYNIEREKSDDIERRCVVERRKMMEERNWDGSSSHATNVQSQLEKQQCTTDDIQTVSRTALFSTFRQASTVAPHLGIRLALCGDPNAS
jgi:hypothetical protein